jgi:hypothetical protein
MTILAQSIDGCPIPRCLWLCSAWWKSGTHRKNTTNNSFSNSAVSVSEIGYSLDVHILWHDEWDPTHEEGRLKVRSRSSWLAMRNLHYWSCYLATTTEDWEDLACAWGIPIVGCYYLTMTSEGWEDLLLSRCVAYNPRPTFRGYKFYNRNDKDNILMCLIYGIKFHRTHDHILLSDGSGSLQKSLSSSSIIVTILASLTR